MFTTAKVSLSGGMDTETWLLYTMECSQFHPRNSVAEPEGQCVK